jgi:hypothetical protein
MPQHSAWEAGMPVARTRGLTVDQLRDAIADMPGHHRVLVDGRPALEVTTTTITGENGGSAASITSGAYEG